VADDPAELRALLDKQAELRALLDKQAIRESVLQYCRGVDRLDLALVRSCYHPDGREVHGSFQGTPGEYAEWLGHVLARYDGTSHLVANQLIELDGDSAWSETYGVARHWGEPATDHRRNFTSGFRFVDRFERRDGAWKVAERTAVLDWVSVEGPETRHPNPGGGPKGARDETDALYRGPLRRGG
jgi:hypothetical protein